jgi:hypothetical protein
MPDIYETALREWITRQIRRRGHLDVTRKDVRNVRHGIDEGWPGTDVTPGDEPEAAILCEVKGSTGWHEHGEHIYDLPKFLRECSEIVTELKAGTDA